ncbi:hypothetical protein TbgDal_XI15830 [Trypanosoma brucei gambiense DAL972]|uniref:Uncharacterized protein n=1 Tax=Trypanosoma brucei gambiense (strain MHOM/CI/86/DAL972) TaxID=679716 RepID=D0A9W3_TRYB9|nr:hypothetical protein TbgDal_XI15830 [Trypanosoma brucei gambiense DAL972]CBH18464.1 hypothetical protein TbgDal_XI15830 [Trypanosoma brucei gambiense DAL972]|eukprot:XP_011780728.1 hypothetical protein TbgDal_XI15830 [Trypanosoma brucei gambiense DAL972]
MSISQVDLEHSPHPAFQVATFSATDESAEGAATSPVGDGECFGGVRNGVSTNSIKSAAELLSVHQKTLIDISLTFPARAPTLDLLDMHGITLSRRTLRADLPDPDGRDAAFSKLEEFRFGDDHSDDPSNL